MSILEASPVVKDLMHDHQIKVIEFDGAADLQTGLMDHQWRGDVVLFGQVIIDGRILPYPVKLHAVIEESKLVRWDLDKSELDTLLEDVLEQPITSYFLREDPDLVLNLYYSETNDHPLIFEDASEECSYLPTAKEPPNVNQPIRGFAFTNS